MKVFFIGAKKTKSEFETSKKVLDRLEELGYKVDKTQMKMSYESEMIDFEDVFKKNFNAIKRSDVVIVETTGLSSGVGFLIATALNQKKPVLTLNNKDLNPEPSLTLRSAKSKYFTFSNYTFDTLDDVINDFFKKLKSILDTKFILIISPEIDAYLEWASDHKRMHKAQIVRNAVEDMMAKDKEWKKSQEIL